MTKITLGLVLIATCLSLLTAAAEARTKIVDGGPKSVSGLNIGTGR